MDEPRRVGSGFAVFSGKPAFPPKERASIIGAERTARRHPPGNPGVNFLFDPPNGVCSDFNSHREQAVLLQLAELGFLDASPIDDLRKPK